MIPSQLQPLANHLWQSTLFAAAAALLTLALRKNGAQTRYSLWLAASIKFLIPFSILVDAGSHFARHIPAPIPQSSLSSVLEQVSEPFAASVPFAAAPAAQPASASLIPAILCAIWAVGFVTLVCSWWLRWRRIRAELRTASPLRLPIEMEVMTSPAFPEPGVFGIRRPVLLLPAGLSSRLTAPRLEAILAHELCHVRRHDNLAAVMHMAVEALFWFHPLVWWLGARLMEERERACDEEVLRMGSDPEVYAGAILKVCELYLESPLPCVAGVTGANLKKRVEAIMTNHTTLRLSFVKKAALAAAGMAALALPVGVGIMNAPPIRAQSGADPVLKRPPALLAQARPAPAATETLSFEMASVTPVVPPERGAYFGPPVGGPGTPNAEQITWTYATLKNILMEAYDVYNYQVSGPTWLGAERYNIVAKVPAGATKEQVKVMWRNLLADRFGVTLHHESKEFQVRELVIAKGGPKLKETTEDPNAPPPPGPPKLVNGDELVGSGMIHIISSHGPNGPSARTVGKAQPLSKLTTMIGNQLNIPVLDKTGLAGKYDFTIDFTPDLRGLLRPPPPVGTGPAASATPNLAAAVLEQLGLALVPNKATLDVVVVDKAEKVPAVN